MASNRLQIMRGAGPPAILLMGVGKDHSWRLEQPVDWMIASFGSWYRNLAATKFSRTSYLVLSDHTNQTVLTLKDLP